MSRLEGERRHSGSNASQYTTAGCGEPCSLSRIYALGVIFQAPLGEAPRWFSETDGEPRTFSENTASDHAGLTVVFYYSSIAAAPFSCASWAKPQIVWSPSKQWVEDITSGKERYDIR